MKNALYCSAVPAILSHQISMNVSNCFWTLYYFIRFSSTLTLLPQCLNYCSLVRSLIPGGVNLPTPFFFPSGLSWWPSWSWTFAFKCYSLSDLHTYQKNTCASIHLLLLLLCSEYCICLPSNVLYWNIFLPLELRYSFLHSKHWGIHEKCSQWKLMALFKEQALFFFFFFFDNLLQSLRDFSQKHIFF